MLRLAIIGTGGFANTHVENFKKINGVKVVACVNRSHEPALKFAEKHEINSVYKRPRELFQKEKLDGVVITASDYVHAKLSLMAIEHGVNVFCEKPLATNAADAWRMVAAAEKKGVINMVNFTYRRASAVDKARKLIAEGRIGQLHLIEAHYFQSWLASKVWGDWKQTPAFLWRLSKNFKSSGVLGDIGCHILDLVTYTIGDDIKKIYCKLKNYDKGVKIPFKGYDLAANDCANMIVEFNKGCSGTINVSRWAAGHKDGICLYICGTKGSIKIDYDSAGDKIGLCTGSNVDKAQWKTVNTGRCTTMFERFIKALKLKKQLSPSFREAAKIQQYIDAAFKSDRLKKEILI